MDEGWMEESPPPLPPDADEQVLTSRREETLWRGCELPCSRPWIRRRGWTQAPAPAPSGCFQSAATARFSLHPSTTPAAFHVWTGSGRVGPGTLLLLLLLTRRRLRRPLAGETFPKL